MVKYKVIPEYYIKNNSLSDSKFKNKENFSAVSFTGKMNIADVFSTKPYYKRLCSKDRFGQILDLLDLNYKKYFEEIFANLKKELKTNPLFENIPNDIKSDILDGHIISLTEKGFMGRLSDAIIAPFTSSVNFIKNKFAGKDKLTEIEKIKQIKTDIANIEGLVDYVDYVENLKEKNPKKFKKLFQDKNPKELIQNKIKKNFTKIKASYSSHLAATLVELTSCLAMVAFNGFDFYNLTRRVDDNHEEAMKEAKLKMKQDIIRLTILCYLMYVTSTVFKKNCNKSMMKMLALASAVQLTAEIINRKVTGRPILPLNDQALKKYEEKEKQKSAKLKNKNILKTDTKTDTVKQLESSKHNNNRVSFTGSSVKNLFLKEIIYSKDELQKILALTQKTDPQRAERFVKLIEERLTGNLQGKKLEEIYPDNQVNNILLGTTENIWGKITKSIFTPVTGIVNLIKKIGGKGKKIADEFIEIKNYLSFVKKLLKNKYQGKDLINNEDTFNEFKRDIMNASLASFRDTEANYNTAVYSIIKRIAVYAIFIAFVATDAYNVTMLHNKGDKKKALIQVKQRIIQDMAKFFVSIYTSSANLILFSELYNKTLTNVFGLSLGVSIANNYLNRSLLGLPILPKNKKQLEELEERNNKSSFYRSINKLIGKDVKKSTG